MCIVVYRLTSPVRSEKPPIVNYRTKRKMPLPMDIHARLDGSREDALGIKWRLGLGSALLTLRAAPDGHTSLCAPDAPPIRQWDNPLDALRWLDQHRHTMPAHRWVGYVAYDLGRYFEQIPQDAQDDLNLPLFTFTCHPLLPQPLPLPEDTDGSGTYIGSNFRPDTYRSAIARAIDYIGAGDIFQVNLSQRFHLRSTLSPQSIYARIQRRFPAWYGALLDYHDFAIVCNSPELFLQTFKDDSGTWHVITRPIKGTRPRSPGMDEELLHSIKDQAELNMIIDLERNDLGRICRVGTVRVPEPRIIEQHPTVYHGAATVEGILRDGIGLVDLLAATFPGGSITGAPKIRAMQIIDELEPTRRGPYCGAIGILDPDGSILLNIAIRILVVKGNDVWIPVGGGIVADSTPQDEYDETVVKARAAMSALGIEIR